MELVLRGAHLNRRLRTSWPDLCNRHERVVLGDGMGRVCLWSDSSWLTVAQVFPKTGANLMRHCFHQWPIHFNNGVMRSKGQEPDISVVIPVAGQERMTPLRCVLDSLSGQSGLTFEVLVVEEGEESVLPTDIRKRVSPVFLQRDKNEPYCKSRMLNAGAEASRGRILLLHDADVVVPASYLREVVQCMDQGYEGVRPIRFLFCLNQMSSIRFQHDQRIVGIEKVADVMQNFPGGSVALHRDVFEQIGGMDEQFKEWGGEDLEFVDRLNTRRIFRGAWLPAIHLWHGSAMQKKTGHRNQELQDQTRAIPAEDRIRQLNARKGMAR